MPRLLRATLAGALISFASAQAEVLVQYDFEQNFLPSTSLTGVTTEALKFYTGTTLGNGNFVRSAVGSPTGTGNLAIQFQHIDDGSAPADGAATPDNFTFTLQPSTAGLALNLDSLTFLSKLNANTTGPGGFYTVQYDDLSDAAGFQFLGSFHEAGSTVQTRTLELTSPLFDNLTQGITFRINFTEPAGASPGNDGNNSMKLDDLTVSGSVIPEPASSALLLAGGMFLARRTRRNRPA